MNNYQREQDSPFARLQLLADLNRAPQVKFNDLASAVNTGVIEENPLNFDIRVDFFRQSDERVITAFTIQTENRDLAFHRQRRFAAGPHKYFRQNYISCRPPRRSF